MAKTPKYTMEKILAVREVLRQLPAKAKEKSRAEVAEFLKTDLRKAVRQGHSLKEIQAIFAEHGVTVSLSRMEAVLGQPGKDSAKKKTDKPTAESLITSPSDVQAKKKEAGKNSASEKQRIGIHSQGYSGSRIQEQ
jgi:transposase